MTKKGYCFVCNKEVDCLINEEQQYKDFHYEVDFIGKKATCSICGEELYDEEVIDYNRQQITKELLNSPNTPRNLVFMQLIKKYGEKQVIVAIEELSELQKELCKALRGKPDIDHITEELADVWIMFQQMKLYFGIDSNEILDVVNMKVERSKKLLLGGNNESTNEKRDCNNSMC